MRGTMRISQDGVSVQVEWEPGQPLSVTAFVEALEGMTKAWRSVSARHSSELLAASLVYDPGEEGS
jgi:hypothetical protein